MERRFSIEKKEKNAERKAIFAFKSLTAVEKLSIIDLLDYKVRFNRKIKKLGE
jgi:hypothetical protein